LWKKEYLIQEHLILEEVDLYKSQREPLNENESREEEWNDLVNNSLDAPSLT